MDHKVGDVVEAETPGGKIKFKILKDRISSRGSFGNHLK